MSDKWDLRFIELAKLVASWSKDPSTQCGAVIVRPDRTVAGVGYNGFPRGVSDAPEFYENREVKYGRIVHAEINAAITVSESLQGYTLYTVPFLTCERCCVQMIQYGIKRVVAPKCPEEAKVRWQKSFDLATELYAQAGVEVVEL